MKNNPMLHAQRGFSLVEMMIAMTIGLMITAGLVTIFANTSNSQQEMRRSAQQIENGRYAMDVLSQDFQVSGYFGSYRKITAPVSIKEFHGQGLRPEIIFRDKPNSQIINVFVLQN